MTINPISSGYPIRPMTPTSAPARPAEASAPAAANATAPLGAPAGATLWHLLSRPEQAHFLEGGSGGPVSYGRRGEPGPSAPAVRGQFLDVKG